jgi:signal transduction histidine kinase
VVFILLGIAGIFLPVLQAWLFFLLAAMMFFPRHRAVERAMKLADEKMPRLAGRLRQLGIGEHDHDRDAVVADPRHGQELRYSPVARAERLIAVGRVVIVAASLVALVFDPSEALFEQVVMPTLAIYVVYAILFALLAWSSPGPAVQRQFATHLFDVAIFAVLMVLTRGPAGPYLLFFVFILLSASLRFRRRGVFWTGVGGVALYLIGALPLLPLLGAGEILVRVAFLSLAAGLVYTLGSYEQEVREEILRAGSGQRAVPADVTELSRQVLSQACRALRAQRMIMSWTDDAEPWVHVDHMTAHGFETVRHAPDRYEPLLHAEVTGCNFISFGSGSESPLVLRREGDRFSESRIEPVHPDFVHEYDLRTFLSVQLPTESVDSRIFVPVVSPPTTDALLLAEVLAELLAVKIDHYHLTREKEQATLDEQRLRLYRDLHDGLLQSMNGVFLQLEAVHSLIGIDQDEARKRLTQAQANVLADQRELRAFIERLRPSSWKPQGRSQIEPLLFALAERYQQEWGMKVDVRVNVAAMLTPVVNGELYSLANEAMANAAKHARASYLRLDLEAAGEAVTMLIHYNGEQFPFRGRYDLETLNSMNAGSLTLRERVSWLKGEMVIESNDDGSAIEIRIPLAAGGAG